MKRVLLIVFLINLFTIETNGQISSESKVLTLQKAFELAVENSVKLKIIEKNKEFSEKRTEITSLNKLPAISTGLSYGYLSNSNVWNPSFSEHRTFQIPHTFTQFSIQASEVVFKGGEINNSIKKASFEELIASLNYDKNKEDIKFLVVAKYLDIYRLINQKIVFENNVTLSEERLKNIINMGKQGMVTQNDVLRNELILSDLNLAILKTSNSIIIANQELNMVLGQELSQILMPDKNLLLENKDDKDLSFYIKTALNENHELKIAQVENEIAQTNSKLSKSDLYPEIAVFANNNLQRPFLNALPAVDIYNNVWQAGIGLRYNIASIYQSPVKIKASNIKLEQTKQLEILTKQNMELSINSYFIRNLEAKMVLRTLKKDLKSAEENYRIVEKKYFNQLALSTDMIDATNTKIEAEIKVTNAEINVVYTRYQLLKATGIIF
jgi:outer membrane protein